jgi:hypothetical protein
MKGGPMEEWKPPWCWWAHEVWMEIYYYDMAFEGAWMKFKRNLILKEIEKHEKENM